MGLGYVLCTLSHYEEHLNEVNETSLNCKGYMKQIQIERVNNMILNCELDIESVQLCHRFCTLSQ